MKKISMIALDLDGTLLNSKKQISTENVRALNAAIEKGIHIVISTGRAYCTLPKQIFDIGGIEYAVTSNGAALIRLSGNAVIYKRVLPRAAVQKILKLPDIFTFSTEFFVDGNAYIDKAEYDSIAANGSDYRNAKYVLETRIPTENICHFAAENIDNIENINLSFKDESLRSNYKELLTKINGASVTSSVHNNLEIGAEGVSKAAALSFLMDKLGIDRNNLLACGDSINDIDMLRLAGIGAAMGNADKQTKAAADIVTDTNDNDGAAKLIFAFIG